VTLYNRLVKLKKELGKTALRSPRTHQEISTRHKYDRVTTILMRRYEYNIDDTLDEYRRQDQIEEATHVYRK
jgi:hypothetical protein